ncbi:hypothetical protein [Williamsia sp.]|uniref:hypothetical protein n=1 Tax=Williamsia sp. TaxID=1872085 RepID=UPI0025CF41CD|nr:hypothetical protein [Williamsia sp.]
MIYLFALIGAVAVSYLVWKAFGPQPKDTVTRGRGPIGPDDDTDFLLDLDRSGRRGPRPTSGGPATPPDDSSTPDADPHTPRPDDDSTGGAPHRDDPRPGAST